MKNTCPVWGPEGVLPKPVAAFGGQGKAGAGIWASAQGYLLLPTSSLQGATSGPQSLSHYLRAAGPGGPS